MNNESGASGGEAASNPRSLAVCDPMHRSLTQREIDEALEREIETARRAVVNPNNDRDTQREFAAIMARLINLRSQEQIERMEREQGLR